MLTALRLSKGKHGARDQSDFERFLIMRLLMFVGMTVGGAIGWWIGSYGGIWTALLGSTVGSVAGIYIVHRLTRDYL